MTTLEARLLSNPLRVQILGAITTGAVTTSELSKRLGTSLATITYHAAVLCSAGCIRLVEDYGATGADLLYEVGE